MNDKQLTLLRRDKIGFIFQSFNLIPTLTARGEHRAAPRGSPDAGRTRLGRRRSSTPSG